MTVRTSAGASRPSHVAGARPASLSLRALRFLMTGPARAKSPWARWTVSALAVAGAGLLVWSAVLHLRLWSEGYSSIPTIGPLFLIQSVWGLVLAVAVVAFRRLALLAAGAVTLAATAAGLLVSAHAGLFGYRESLTVPYAMLSLDIEFTGAAVLLVAALLLAWTAWPASGSGPDEIR
ncbi:MAG TPA: hypothetical protein VG142_00785 [Trebonia sp.]|nr:hypothetical protein [Trebonia sp.]